MSGVPPGWARVTIADITEAVDTVNPKASPEREFTYVDISSIDNSMQAIASPKVLKGSEAPSRARRQLRSGDTVFSTVRTYLRNIGYVDATLDGALGSTGFAVLRPALGIHSRYLYYHSITNRFVDGLTAMMRGTSYPAVVDSQVREMPIAVAPTAEQERIVAAIEEQFSRLDAAETVLRNTLHRLKALRIKAIAAAYKGDWPRTTLGEIAEITGGVTKDSKREGDPSFIEVPYLRVANVQRGYLDLTEVAAIRVSSEKAQALMLREGDVLFNEGGDRDKLGRGWVWSGEIDRCIHQNHVFRARLSKGFDPRFVSWHGNTFGQSWFDTHGRQTTNLASLNLTTLKSFPVPAPPLAEQLEAVAEIERRLSIIDATTNMVNSAFIQGKALRRAILERAFSGKLLPQDPNDEPASVLLERVMTEGSSSNGAKHAKARSPRRRMATA